MNTTHQTSVSEEDRHANKTISSHLIRWAGLSAAVAGIIFAGIQPVHPPDVGASVSTTAWTIITSLKTAMCLLFLLGIGGIYARQVNKAGWLGLAGFLMLLISWTLQTAFVFAEAFILPVMVNDAPHFVDGLLRNIAGGEATDVNLGALPTIYSLGVGMMYILGGLVFGIATLRAAILPRWAAILLAVSAALTPFAALLPHNIQRLAAIPVGLALALLGFALWSERREQATATAPSAVSAQLRQPAAK